MENKTKNDYICADCGDIFLTRKQRYRNRRLKWTDGQCDLCEAKTSVSHIKNFNYLKLPSADNEQ